jgi:hypothetical protein
MGVSYVSKMMIFFVLILGLIGSLSQESAFKDNSMIAEGKNS